jgi:hypothetical protein
MGMWCSWEAEDVQPGAPGVKTLPALYFKCRKKRQRGTPWNSQAGEAAGLWCSPAVEEIGQMALRNPQRKKPKPCPLELAVAAVEHDGSVLDLPAEGFDPSPGALDLPEMEQPCPRCARPAVDTCPECGSPVCGHCLGLAGTEDSA